MKTYSVILTPEAEADLRDIYRYIASVLQERTPAQRLITKLRDSILELDTIPERWNRYEREPWFSRGLRKAIVGNYVIFYLVQESAVLILAILYGKREPQPLLDQRITNQ